MEQKTIDNKMSLEFMSKSTNEGFARAAVAAFAAQLDPTLEELADIKTAVSEGVTNAIIHGYGTSSGVVHIDCEISGKMLRIAIIDRGRGIEDIAQAVSPLYTSAPEMERSGMGFTVMETFMDSMEVESVPGVGTTIRLTKQIGTQQSTVGPKE